MERGRLTGGEIYGSKFKITREKKRPAGCGEALHN